MLLGCRGPKIDFPGKGFSPGFSLSRRSNAPTPGGGARRGGCIYLYANLQEIWARQRFRAGAVLAARVLYVNLHVFQPSGNLDLRALKMFVARVFCVNLHINCVF